MREKNISAESVNISEGGILCRSDEPVEPLTSVFLMLSIPGETGDYLMKIEGMVMHSAQREGSWLFGVAFNQLSQEDRHAIAEYLANCAPA